ncbi:CRISPR-associated protein, Csn1 family [Anaerovibrio sp. JC8]|uniref:type II CRISPR RNA-guided endonuclease Cas9 n=1 Tax=Anaerovibrio sp. JC8 TaxID=1240085 RepID=UPI000A0CBBA7|nr:type II CRISPR RNA-guided endonuclease Cas9 [Anaerovibrio sp. JC8]ORU00682.1 CRISPR-associated protein, Csn1 family [Anaerovibrio sp. JC8]
MKRKVGFGLDVGIGSVGFAVLSYDKVYDARIEQVGVRLFDSGEEVKNHKRASKNQGRRQYRSGRRLIRRRYHRKERAKRFIERIGLLSAAKIKEWQEVNGNQNIYSIRFRGLSEKLTPEEIADCVIHFCNHRGYREFYEDDVDEKEAGKIKTALFRFDEKMTEGKYVSVADMILHDKEFATDTQFPNFHNHKNDDEEKYFLIKRAALRDELRAILQKQQEYYKQLTDQNIAFLCDEIVFVQRDFEDGPGDKNDKNRKFMGFLDTIGCCMFYKEELRGFRSTVIADIYSLVNGLSQMMYVDSTTGEITFLPEAADDIIEFALKNASITEKDIKKILEKYNLTLIKAEKLEENIPQTIKTLKVLKKVLDASGYSYDELIQEEQFDFDKPSKLHELCNLLASNITPKRRRKALEKAGWNKDFQAQTKRIHFGGTSNVCYRYMLEAIDAFRHGELYGNFQARRKQEQLTDEAENTERVKLLPPFTKEMDEDVVKNVVVFKAINETRKIINALIGKYGSPAYINIEVADELGHSIETRRKMTKANNDNMKKKEAIGAKLVELGLRKEGEVSGKDIARYRLWEQQNGIDLYTGNNIPEADVLSGQYDVDHIIPFSLILDDTLNNKVLTGMGSNRQAKSNTAPREYLSDKAEAEFIKRVNVLLKKKISKKKYQYLMVKNLRDSKLLNEWKSRNINDTRYISRFLANYLNNTLIFNSDKKKNVYAINGAITSRMRKMWLNKKTWGNPEKNRENNLHHAADAIVIANLTPAAVELASDNLKLQNIFRQNGKRVTEEYENYLDRAVRKIEKYYHFNPELAKKLLVSKDRIPSMVRLLREETDKRLVDPSLEEFKMVTPESFRQNLEQYYNDPEFVASIQMPLVSYKQSKRFSGSFTKDKPIKKKEREDSSTVKIDSLGNENILDAKSYYCLEVYSTKDNKTALRGLRYVDFKLKDKKMFITVPNPENYGKHIMYLFKNDYIVVYNKKGEEKARGFYSSVKAITRDQLYLKDNNTNVDIIFTIKKDDTVKKYHIDILGQIGGEIKCSAPFLSITEKE